MSELAASRALYRGFLFLIVAIGIALLVRELIWVLVQLFIAAIVAASMSPIVDAFTNSTRARRLPWRPSRALVVLATYLVVGRPIRFDEDDPRPMLRHLDARIASFNG